MKKLLVTILPLLLAVSVYSKDVTNVVFFLVDDFGYYDISLTGSEVFETPNIDKLASAGTLFTEAHAAYPRCVPSRFAMITGVHPSRAESKGQSPGNLDSEYTTIAHALKQHGFATYFAGKWHIGKDPAKNYPDAVGFDINFGGGSAGAPGAYFFPFTSQKKLTGPETIPGKEGDYLTDALTDRTIEFIENHKRGPFFVYLSHYAVHTPIQGKKNKTQRYQKKIDGMEFDGPEYVIDDWQGRELRHQSNAGYAAMVESVDESLGRIIGTLKQNGIYENTIIILTSDHGGLSNSGPENKRELATSNLPLRAGKGHMYQGGLRIPVIVRWPGKTPGGSTVDFPITGMDYYPSILEMLGLPLQPQDHVDGVSFVPGVLGESEFNADRPIFWYSDSGRFSSTGDRNAAVIRKGDFKLIEFFNDNKIELYNLKKDPGELNDLAGKQTRKRDELYAELKAWKALMKVRDREQRR